MGGVSKRLALSEREVVQSLRGHRLLKRCFICCAETLQLRFLIMSDFGFCWLILRWSYGFYLRFLGSRSLPNFTDELINSWILESPDSIPILIILLRIFTRSLYSVPIRTYCAPVGPF